MHLKVTRIIESFLIVGLLMPAGLILGQTNQEPLAVHSSNANWYDVEQATNTFQRMRKLAVKVRSEVAYLHYQEYQIPWQLQAVSLNEGRNYINRINSQIHKLVATKEDLEPWQASLVNKVAPNAHEMAYQMEAAINRLNAHKNRTALAAEPEYAKNIGAIYTNANQLAGTIKTVTRYANVEEKVAAMEQTTANAGS